MHNPTHEDTENHKGNGLAGGAAVDGTHQQLSKLEQLLPIEHADKIGIVQGPVTESSLTAQKLSKLIAKTK